MVIIKKPTLRLKQERNINLHRELCLIGEKFFRSQNFGVVIRDGFKAATATGEQPDLLGFNSVISCLAEIKISRKDFLADFKKPFRIIDSALGMGDWRFYICPPGVIEPVDLPEGWGLLHVENGKVKEIVGWPPNTKWAEAPFLGKTNKTGEREIMYSALRRMDKLGHLNEIYNGSYGRCSLCDKLLPRIHEVHEDFGLICKNSCT